MARDRQTSLRLEGVLLEKLQKAARDNRRTLAAEISLRLEQSFQPSEPTAVLQQIAEASKVLAEAGAKLAGGTPMDEVMWRSEESRRLADELKELEAAERVLARFHGKEKVKS